MMQLCECGGAVCWILRVAMVRGIQSSHIHHRHVPSLLCYSMPLEAAESGWDLLAVSDAQIHCVALWCHT